jgi:EmrB/QacA subfamily drug resistance transporter
MNRSLILAVLCLCAFAVNVDTTLVNVALPTLVGELDAGTRELQWIVDAYTLTFAALVLACGALSDRYGRREALVAGLVVYGVGNGLASLTDSAGALIATRAIMGVGAAIIFPTTLSIIVQVFQDRAGRAQAIGLWGASTGVAVALGPIVGGALLESASWQATFAVKVPVALAAIALVLAVVPTSKDPSTPRLDRPGLALSALAIGLVVFAVIEAPEAGWGSVRTLASLAAGVAAVGGFVWWERRASAPMLDLRLFRSGRFSAASLSVTVAFFALAGFIFLITQYFQFLKGYGPLETGLRLLPVATFVALTSVLGTRLAVRVGNKLVISTGLGLLAAAYAWISTVSVETPYLEIAGQMVVLGSGMGLTGAPATESIMGVVSTARAGIGSAINDTTRELGATLGVAVIGSVYASLYAGSLDGPALAGVPAEAQEAAGESIGGAVGAVSELAAAGAGEAAGRLQAATSAGFFDGLQAGCLVAAGVCLAGALFCAIALPSRPGARQAEPGGTAGAGGDLRPDAAAAAAAAAA